MVFFILRRIASAAILLFAISTVAYLLIYLASGDIARNLLGINASEEQVLAKAHELGLDRPLFERYIDWLGSALHGDFGTSWFTNEPVLAGLAYRVPVTLSITVGAILITAVASIGLGMLSALRRGWFDRVVQVLVVLGFGIPGFLIALIFVIVFALQLGWFPATGYVPPAVDVGGWIMTITLPVLALAIGSTAAATQQVRGAAIDILRQDYIRTARSRGIGERTIIFKYVLRNAAPPALTILSLQFIGLLGGAVIIEQVFAIPGIGAHSILATTRGDIPVVMGVVVVTVVIVVIVNLLIDLANAWLNPKVRVQ